MVSRSMGAYIATGNAPQRWGYSMNFWEKIARGHTRLSEFEDRLIWRMRGAGETWDAIEARINAIRQNRSLVGDRA